MGGHFWYLKNYHGMQLKRTNSISRALNTSSIKRANCNNKEGHLSYSLRSRAVGLSTLARLWNSFAL